jgi:ABC-type multidrug transport system fused ATPase/permease subunit
MNLINNILKNFFKEEKYTVILVIILSLLINIFKVNIISYTTSNIIKSLQNNNIKYAYEYYKYFIITGIIFILIFYYNKIVHSKLIVRVKYWSRLFIVKNIYYNNHENLSTFNFTKLHSPIIRLTNSFNYFSSLVLNKFIPSITLILIIFGYFIYKNTTIGCIFLFGNLTFILYLYYQYNILYEKYKALDSKFIKNDDILNENLNNFSKIIFRGTKDSEINILSLHIDEIYNTYFDLYNFINKILLIINSIIYLIVFAIIGYIIYLYSKKNINLNICIVFIIILLLYRDLILSTFEDIPNILENFVRIKEIPKIFEENVNLIINKKNIKNNILINNSKFDNIEFKNICFKYDLDSKKIFDNLNFKIDLKNNIVGLFGLSGNGKSTIIKLLLKLYKYDGNILINDTDIQNIDTKFLRKNIIYVDQSANLFDKTIIENIKYGINNKNDYILSKKYFNEAMKYPAIKLLYKDIDFEEYNVGLNGMNLSGGQRQVINIINGLISPSIITILDEPTNALDPELKKEVIQLIKDFKKYNKCIIIITHDKDIHPILDQIIKI